MKKCKRYKSRRKKRRIKRSRIGKGRIGIEKGTVRVKADTLTRRTEMQKKNAVDKEGRKRRKREKEMVINWRMKAVKGTGGEKAVKGAAETEARTETMKK